MVKLLVLSDLHVEFAPFVPDAGASAAADVVVLAGDIHKGDRGIRWAAEVFPGRQIVYVAGNHEFYGGHWEKTISVMRTAAEDTGIHFMENDSIVIQGVRFLGATLWTDFDYYGRDRRGAALRAVERGLNDFRLIGADPMPDVYGTNKRHKLTALHTLKRHQASLAWLRQELPKGDPARTVVVVHHSPRAESTAQRYATDELTPGFASKLPDDLMAGAHLWVHGHVHDSFDYRLGVIRVVCNPRGYPLGSGTHENSAFEPGLLLDVVSTAP